MPEPKEQGVVEKRSLTDVELTDIRALADICLSYEDIDLRIAWSALQSQAGDIAENFLFYQGDTLIGFLALSGVGSDEAEVGGMVHPRHRRKGVFTQLVSAAREVCRRYGTGSLVFICDRRSEPAKAFLESIGAEYEFSEQKMKLEASALPVPPDGRLDFRKALIEDAGTIARIIADDSGMDETYFRQIVARGIQGGARRFYIAEVGDATIGTINIDVIDGDPYIYGFVIRPEHRGRGYGRQMLARAIDDVVSRRPQPIYLEVETDNTVALALYRSFGFVATHTYDYYRLKT